jgi:HAE1 family hydrophobic/amphiphilic exporter-1
MGTTVIGGMLAATGLAIFIIPALYVLVERVASMGKRAHTSADVCDPTPVEVE